VKDMK